MLSSLNQRNLYRGPASSEEFNKRNKLIRDDIASMYHLLNENEKLISKNMDIVLRENFFLNNEIRILKRQLEDVKATLQDPRDDIDTDLSRKVHIQNFYTNKDVTDSNKDRNAKFNQEYGIVYPTSTDTLSRFGYTTDSGEVFVPNSLEIHIKEGNDSREDAYGEPLLEEVSVGDTSAIVDKNKNTFFTRTVTYPITEAIHELFGEIHIIIPTEGFQNIYTNTLKIAPYPEGSMKLLDIQYKGYNDQWNRLETYPTIDGNPQVIENLHKIMFQFPETEMIELKIKFSQPYWFENEDKAMFTYGFQDITLEYNTFTEKTCEFVTKIDLSEDNLYFKKVLEPIAIAADGSLKDLTDMVEFEIYYDSDLSRSFMFGTTILSDVQTIYIKTLLKKDGNSIPVLKEIKYPYLYFKK